MTEKQLTKIMYEVCDSLNVPLTHEESELIMHYSKAINREIGLPSKEKIINGSRIGVRQMSPSRIEFYKDNDKKELLIDVDFIGLGCSIESSDKKRIVNNVYMDLIEIIGKT